MPALTDRQVRLTCCAIRFMQKHFKLDADYIRDYLEIVGDEGGLPNDWELEALVEAINFDDNEPLTDDPAEQPAEPVDPVTGQDRGRVQSSEPNLMNLPKDPTDAFQRGWNAAGEKVRRTIDQVIRDWDPHRGKTVDVSELIGILEAIREDFPEEEPYPTEEEP